MKLADLKAYIEEIEEQIQNEAIDNPRIERNPDVFLFKDYLEYDFNIVRALENGNVYMLEK